MEDPRVVAALIAAFGGFISVVVTTSITLYWTRRMQQQLEDRKHVHGANKITTEFSDELLHEHIDALQEIIKAVVSLKDSLRVIIDASDASLDETTARKMLEDSVQELQNAYRTVASGVTEETHRKLAYEAKRLGIRAPRLLLGPVAIAGTDEADAMTKRAQFIELRKELSDVELYLVRVIQDLVMFRQLK